MFQARTIKTINELNKMLRGNIGIQAIISIIGTSTNTLWILFIPYYLNSFGLEASIGFIYSFAALFGALGYFIGGRLGDRYGRKKAIIMGDLICCLSPLLLLTKKLYLIIVGLLIVFFGLSFIEPNKFILLVESTPSKLKATLLMFATRVLPSIPPIILAPIGAQLYETGLYDLSLILGFMGFLTSMILTLLMKETLIFKKSRISRTKGELLLQPSILLLILVFAIPTLSSKAIDWYVPLYFKNRKLTIGFYGYVISASSAAAMAGSLLAGIAIDVLSPYKTVGIGLSLMAMSLMFFSFPQPPFLYIVLYSSMLFIRMIFVASPPIVIAKHYDKEKRSTYMGFLGIGNMIAGIVGPSITSLMLSVKVTPFIFFSILNIIAIFIVSFKKELF